MLAPLKLGSSGWGTYGLQRAIGVTPADGTFGPETKRKLVEWQRARGLTPDGIAGPATQTWILRDAGAEADRVHGLPEGVGYGFAVAEGGGILGATNWSAPGGVDCGPAQWRIYGPPYSQEALRAAFRPYRALDDAASQLKARMVGFKRRNPRLDDDTLLKVAVLAHNWPSGADSIVRTFRPGYDWWRAVAAPDALAIWAKQADGSFYTRAEWCRHYAESILRFVA